MVSVNITLLVELGLFLVFLWVTARIVIRPALTTMDKRSARIEGDRASADDYAAKTDDLKRSYHEEITTARRAAKRKIAETCRQALSDRVDAIADRRRHGQRLVDAVRATAQQQEEAQRPQYAALVARLAESLVANVTTIGRPQ